MTWSAYRFDVPVDPERVAALFLVAVVVIAVPGPSVLFVVSRALAHGRRAALATVAGNEVGLLVQVVAVAVGVGAIVQRSIAVYTVIKLLGAAYLIYLGVQAFRHRTELADALDQAVPAIPPRRIFRQGVIVGVSNPKGFLLFSAILPQFTDPTAGPIPLQLLLLGLVCVLIALVSDSVWALLAGTAGTWLGRSPRRLSTIGGGAGAVMVGLGVQVAVSGRRD
jgi:threonine/homoserine/homoserine lactone efflux protein